MPRTPDALERLRGFRTYPDRAQMLTNDVQTMMKSLRRVSAGETAAIEAWETVAPDELRESTDALGMDRGKLIVRVPSAAMRYKADNWLRSGGLRELQSLARVPIRSVSMKIVPRMDDPKHNDTRM